MKIWVNWFICHFWKYEWIDSYNGYENTGKLIHLSVLKIYWRWFMYSLWYYGKIDSFGCYENISWLIHVIIMIVIQFIWFICLIWKYENRDSYAVYDNICKIIHMQKMKIFSIWFVWWLMKLIYLVWLILCVRKFSIFDSYINNEIFIHMTHVLSVKYCFSVIHITCMKNCSHMIRFFVMTIFVTRLIFYGWDILCIDS